MNRHSGNTHIYIGIDLGTSGCRAIAIDMHANVIHESGCDMEIPKRDGQCVEQSPAAWWQAIKSTLGELLKNVNSQQVRAIAIDGTSASVLLADRNGQAISPALMYNDARAVSEAQQIDAIAPPDCAAHGVTSALAKCLWLQKQDYAHKADYLLTQTDWVTAQFTGVYGISDKNNCMKLGYDALNNNWPDWLNQLDVKTSWLPQVLQPGSPIGKINRQAAELFGLNKETIIVAGTTDSTAAFLATGASQPGEAVTSLGSTLVLKVVCAKPVFAAEYGIYSQPLNDNWLVGGASNSGGGVLLEYFTQQQLDEMTPGLHPESATGLDYYPLPGKGERFPVRDPAMQAVLSPRPDNDTVFFQGMLEGIARIELQGYQRLAELGVPYPASIRTIGGGSKNPAWQVIRENLLKTTLLPARHNQAAYGSALLARQSFMASTR